MIHALIFLAFSAVAVAQPRGERPPPPDQIITDNADALGLSAEVLAEIEALFAAARPTMEAAQAGDEAAREAAHAEGRATMEAVMALLTEAQQEALRELLPPPPPPGQRSVPGRR